MKKYHLLLLQILLAAAVLAGVSFKTSALSYRGFIDIEPVAEFWKVPHFNNLPATNYDEEQILTFAPALATIHGVQWRKFFIGIGAQGIVGIPTSDCYMTSEKQVSNGYGFRYRYDSPEITNYLSVPVFLCLRFDFFGTSKNNFFIEARAGKSIAFQKGDFGQVIIGGRRRHGKNHGVSYGIIVRTRQMELWSSPDPTTDNSQLYDVHTKFKALGVGFHLGFDF